MKTYKGNVDITKEIQVLIKIEAEINTCFEGWDGAIKNNQHPVTIQDLDFWSKKLRTIIDELANQPYSLPSERMM